MTELMNKEEMRRALLRLSHQILEKNKKTKDLVIVGIHRRGAFLARRIGQMIKEIEGEGLLTGTLDITLYRDDLTRIAYQPVVRSTDIPFPIDDKKIILVDDVLYTGRTVRAAIDALLDFGRPQRIELAILVDRGHRELPLRADYVGKNIPTSSQEMVEVRVEELDGEDKVIILKRQG